MAKCILGIESTAHTFGVAVVSMGGKILSNVKDSYTTESGGMIPLEVRAHYKEVADGLYEKALGEAGVLEDEIDCVAFSNAPGLAPCLLEGLDFVKKVAKRLGVPIVCVNHCVAHLEIGEVVGARDPVMLYVSGANTQVIAYEAGRYRVFGETLDLGVGNFIDTIGRFMGLGFPAGPKIEKLASGYVSRITKESNGSRMNTDGHELENKKKLPEVIEKVGFDFSWSEIEKKKNETTDFTDLHGREFLELLDLPYSVKGMDVAFAGMQTKIRNLLAKGEDRGKIAYSMQEVVFAMLVEVAERALAHTGKKELLLGGGVACNSRLVEMCREMCSERNTFPDRFAIRPLRYQTASLSECGDGEVKLFVPPKSLLVDNAGMIGYLGAKMFRAGLGKSVDEVDVAPRERTDEVEILWR